MATIARLRARLGGRTLELELLITAFLFITICLAALIAGAGGRVRWVDLTIIGAFAGLFLTISLALALRDWGEEQMVLPIAALLAGIGMIMARRLEPDLVQRYGEVYGGIAFKQVIWIFGGAVLLALVSFVPWRLQWLKHYRYTWLLLGLALVGATAVFGVERNGARLWLSLGFFSTSAGGNAEGVAGDLPGHLPR